MEEPVSPLYWRSDYELWPDGQVLMQGQLGESREASAPDWKLHIYDAYGYRVAVYIPDWVWVYWGPSPLPEDMTAEVIDPHKRPTPDNLRLVPRHAGRPPRYDPRDVY